ncbi:hypothetical protein GGF46_001334 [Coemansia sp. RSA 552]|nr:hypothetical protein GGF46_001334 [Coemansia sp. RSA 552]
MRMYGVSGIRAHIRKNVAQAKWLEEQLLADGRFEIMAPVVFGLVVFRIGPSALPASVTENDHNALNKANVELVDRINREGRIFILITDLQGKCIIRAPIGAVHGSQRNIDTLLAVLQQHTTAVVCQFT